MKPKLRPLEQWICDHCRELIEEPEHGWLEWQVPTNEDRFLNKGFRIVHHAAHSPRRPRGDCYQGEPRDALRADGHLTDFLGHRGLVRLLSMIDPGPHLRAHRRDYVAVESTHEFMQIVRRLHYPYFEEARLYWNAALRDGFFDGANEVWPYLPETLKVIIGRYGS